MSPRRLALLLVAIGGVLLVANSLWLFPNEGDTRYTYERSEVRIADGTLQYDGADLPGFAEENSLNPVGCQVRDDEQPRACAFDRHLVTHGPVTVPRQSPSVIQPDFVSLDGTLYRRTHRSDGPAENATVTHDVERVSPEVVLEESARPLSMSSPLSDTLPYRVAISGDTVTSTVDLDETDLGDVYRLDESYYTVVATDREHVDHGLTWLRYERSRYLLSGVGTVLVVGAIVVYRRNRPR